MYNSTFDPTIYGFTTILQLFNALDEIIKIKNNVLYTKLNFPFSEFYKNIKFYNNIPENQVKLKMIQSFYFLNVLGKPVFPIFVFYTKYQIQILCIGDNIKKICSPWLSIIPISLTYKH